MTVVQLDFKDLPEGLYSGSNILMKREMGGESVIHASSDLELPDYSFP